MQVCSLWPITGLKHPFGRKRVRGRKIERRECHSLVLRANHLVCKYFSCFSVKIKYEKLVSWSFLSKNKEKLNHE